MADWFSRDDAYRLSRRVLALSSAEGCQVDLSSRVEGNTRSAGDGITTSGDSWTASLTVTSRFSRRSASVTTNRFDEASLRQAVESCERIARLAPENPELMPLLGPQEYRPLEALFRSTVGLDARARADAARETFRACDRAGFKGAGFIQCRSGASAMANSAGLFGYHASSQAAHSLTVRTLEGDGSGWAGTTHNDWRRVRPAPHLAASAIEKALRSRDPVTLDPGKYTVVLEPTAVANLLTLLTFAMSARAADEGRSFFSRRGGGNLIGEAIVDQRVTILSDPRDPDLLGSPFNSEGLPIGRTHWIENGIVRNLSYDRFWAEKQGVAPVPAGGGIKMLGTDQSLDQLVAGVDRGLLVTRFWYIRGVDPRTILYTGLTRDGVFLIEAGKVTRAVRNFRFNESPVQVLRNLVALGRPERVMGDAGGELGGPAIVVPPVVTRDFTFTSVSEAV